ncbi:MAG TPA: hypothetical protein PJ991_08540 [Kiritimatiellia bacterium]|nr:hypothetical protein [Kiritimatiellia bacterium]
MNRILAVWLAIAAVASASEAATLINPGFETGDFTGWFTFGQGWRTGVGDDARTGDFGMVNDVLTTDDNTFRGIFQEVAVTAGNTYSAGVYIRAVNIQSSESWFELQWLNSDGGVLDQLQSGHITGDQPFSLAAISGIVAPVGAVTASVRGIVFMPDPPAEEADFHIFDDFFLIDHDDLQIDIASDPSGGVTVQWSTNATVLHLEFTADLLSGDWELAPETPALHLNRWIITNSAATPETIYRLSAP